MNEPCSLKAFGNNGMIVRVIFFGAARELAQCQEEVIDVQTSLRTSEVFEEVMRRHPALRQFGRSLLIAVNQSYARTDDEVRHGDEIAIFPPVSGGANDEGCDFFELTSCPIAVGELARRVVLPQCGATVTFDGYTRRDEGERRTRYLEYEAYESMALKELRRLGKEARTRFEIAHIGIVHRTGRVECGETSVAIVVSAAHRRSAFEACEWAISELKRRVPIWKKEFFEGGEVWVNAERIV